MSSDPMVTSIYNEGTKALMIGIGGFCAWNIAKLAKVPTTIPSTAIAVAGMVYSIFYTLAISFFQKIGKADPSSPNFSQSHYFFWIQLASEAVAILSVHAIGLMTIAQYSITTSLEFLALIKGFDLVKRFDQIIDKNIGSFVENYVMAQT